MEERIINPKGVRGKFSDQRKYRGILKWLVYIVFDPIFKFLEVNYGWVTYYLYFKSYVTIDSKCKGNLQVYLC